MSDNKHYDSVVSAAYAIVDMDRELLVLRAENARLKLVEKEYREFVLSSIKNNDATSRNMVELAINGMGFTRDEG